MNKKLLYTFIASFIVGVALFSLYIEFWYVVFLFPLTLFFQREMRFVFLIILCAFLLGGTRVILIDLKQDMSVLDQHIGEEIIIKGIVVEEPNVKERSTQIVVQTKYPQTRIITYVERFPEFQYGDELKLKGVLKRPENFKNDRGRDFNYVKYLAKDGIYYTLSFPEVKLISSGHGNIVKRTLFFVKQKWLSQIQKIIPDPHSALLGGLVVGAKESLGSSLEDDFRKTGIIHIVVLSGYNVTIVAEAFMRFFSFLPRLFSLSLGAFSIVLFALLTGASATIVRASLMALLVLLARATGRTSEITHALFIAAFGMVLHNPMIVLYDPSFQLSFLATLGLIYVSPRIETYFKLVPTKWQLREFATATIATQIFVLPLLIYMMGELSLVAVPVNILVLALIPLTMLFGFLAGVIGFVSTTLAFPFTLISYIFLSYELFVVDVFATLPFASLKIPSIPLWAVCISYIIYAFLLLRSRKKIF